MKNAALARLVQWTPQSSAEDVDRIYTTSALGLAMERLERGKAWLVLGRKGVGKSALIYKFLDTYKEGVLARKREFDPVLIRERVKFFGAEGIRSSAYKAFKLDILLLAADELRLNLPDGRTRKAARRIAQYYDGKWLTSFLSKLRRTKLFSSLSKTFLGTEEIGDAVPGLIKDVSMIDKELLKVEGMMRELCARLPNQKRVYIIFDEVDLTLSKLRELRDAPSYLDYIESLAALLQACSTFSDLRHAGIPVYPVIVLRDDIFREIGGADAGKWEGSAINISFSPSDIEDLLRHRLLAELEETGIKNVPRDATLLKVWSYYSDNGICSPTKKTILQLLLQRTLNRPRDVVQFMSVLANTVARRPTATKITPTDFDRARTPYAKYFWNEFLDEMGYKYPFLHMIGQTLYEAFFPEVAPGVTNRRSDVRGATLRQKFGTLRKNLEREGVQIGSEEELINDLLAGSILGVQIPTQSGSKVAYHYLDGVERTVTGDGVYYLHGAVSDYFYLRSGKDTERSPLDIESFEVTP